MESERRGRRGYYRRSVRRDLVTGLGNDQGALHMACSNAASALRHRQMLSPSKSKADSFGWSFDVLASQEQVNVANMAFDFGE